MEFSNLFFVVVVLYVAYIASNLLSSFSNWLKQSGLYLWKVASTPLVVSGDKILIGTVGLSATAIVFYLDFVILGDIMEVVFPNLDSSNTMSKIAGLGLSVAIFTVGHLIGETFARQSWLNSYLSKNLRMILFVLLALLGATLVHIIYDLAIIRVNHIELITSLDTFNTSTDINSSGSSSPLTKPKTLGQTAGRIAVGVALADIALGFAFSGIIKSLCGVWGVGRNAAAGVISVLFIILSGLSTMLSMFLSFPKILLEQFKNLFANVKKGISTLTHNVSTWIKKKQGNKQLHPQEAHKENSPVHVVTRAKPTKEDEVNLNSHKQ